MFNIFRAAGDLSHLISILILLNTIQKSRSIAGISLKTQILYVLVFLTRYLDLTYRYVSIYNTLMKLFFISSSIYIVYLMIYKFKNTETEQIDTFPIEYLIGGSFILSLIFNYKFQFGEILWSFSLWLESVAILPQLFMLQRTGEARTLTTHYIFALGAYRTLYIPNWIFRWISEGRVDYLAIFTGIVQTIIYSDFFYIYYHRVLKGFKFELPQ
ncbi:ER lumen protein retaining receptor 2 [Wickerhamomyces ciferrii]|uniref:ER lumen protein-retaining receptor n=1 Tax=Wickerhamomyces ciferrii (strain ATCC 14091 / BCRC 22168 / CBS 111 / JCM 3599 / NBRC 0793 / NRRL Y-1031 F-60-10) TaxID=1206466 RepID=K0KKT6_WICCF|nr:ER lumen protein retaining receptor 2 [Wickerhamomyces ciferrii]CCH42079.1 ER lumen protein retaining receptor 2 [Wickerhamomyces ciferrii]